MEANIQIFSGEIDIKFHLRQPKVSKPTPVYIYLNLSGRKYKIGTGVRVTPEQWNVAKGFAYVSPILTALDNRNNEITNKRINECKQHFIEFKNYLCDNPDIISENCIDNLKERIYSRKKDMAKKEYANPILFLQQIIEAHYGNKKNTKESYLKAVKYLSDYCIANDIELKDLNELNLEFLYEFREWLKMKPSKHHKEDNDKLSIRVINSQFTILLKVLKYVDKSLYDFATAGIYAYKALPVKDTSENEIALTEDEIERIYNLELEENDAKIRDAFIFQCFTGQRYNEIKNFATSFREIDTKDGRMFEVVQQKGSKIVKVPITSIAKKILDRNNGKIEYKENKYTNDVLRKIAKKAGLNEDWTRSKFTNDGLRTHSIKRWEAMSTHVARRSFVTIAKQNEIDDRDVMNVTGHNNRQMLDLYNKIDKTKSAVKTGGKIDDIFTLDKDGNIDKEKKIRHSKNESRSDFEKEIEITSNLSVKQINEYKNILAFLGAPAIDFVDVNDIDTLCRLIYVEYEAKLTQMGIDYHIVKDLYNSSTTTLKEKKKALDKLVKEIKEKTSNKLKKKKK